ncbi:hypothetical protein B808_991 [Fructilactobacillus florum 8D]|uniref:DUF2922 domain-containing protein n=1 Tax=Fructilactobacillus florum 8D TaxID=1221538 RepID=W9EDF6_9LACO|nr:DUF2922 domain-containing protein [Fructilactobacillus florum]EKK20831.1 hypothetical protein B807_389 [Fructilactobacillus florum 2F]ETO40107.1 hypothetical protein B808_991 [Fructilactobacillus florum 8D]
MKVLELVFKSEQHKLRTLKLNYANQDLQSTETKALMQRIAALEMFQKDGVQLYVTPVAARYSDNQVSPIFDDSKPVA